MTDAPPTGDSELLIGALLTGVGMLPGDQITAWFAEPAHGERAITVDQTNRSVVVGERAVVKWLLDTDPVGHPAPDRLAALVASGFSAMPRPWGLLHRLDPETGKHALVAIVTSYLPGTLDGWEWAVDLVRAYAQNADVDPLSGPRRIGDITAEMHLGLASTGVERAQAPDVRSWCEDAERDLAEAVQVLNGPEALRLANLAPRIRSAFHAIGECTGTPLIDVHGDFHVGQILHDPATTVYYVTDFDGHPLQTATERIRRQPAARDVASMLCSLDHVGRIVIHRTAGVDAGLVLDWVEAAQLEFISAYRAGLAAAGAADLLDERLLGPFRVQQECREFVYSVRHLPHWRYVPDAALPYLLDRLPPRQTNSSTD